MGNVQITVAIGNQTLFSVSAINAADAIAMVVGQLQLALNHFNAQKSPPPATIVAAQPIPVQVQPVPAQSEDAARRAAAGM